MKRIVSFLMVLSLLLGCCSFAAAEEQTVIRFAWWGGQERTDRTVAAIEDFMKKNPDIKVEYEFAGYNEHFTKLTTQAAGNMMADVIQMDISKLAQFADSGLLLDLAPFAQSGVLDLANVSEGILSSGKVNDTLYAIPAGTNAKMLAYRPDVLAAAGLTMPEKLTVSEFTEMAKTVYEKTGRTIYGFYAGTADVELYLRNFGLTLYNEDQTALGFDDPKYVAFMGNFYAEGTAQGYVLGDTDKTAMSVQAVADKDTWAMIIDSNLLASYAEGSNCELDVTMIPQFDGATAASTYLKPTMLWCVNGKSDKQEAAVRLVNYLTNDAEAYASLGMDRGMPVSSEVRAALEANMSVYDQKVAAMLGVIGQDGNNSPLPPTAPAYNNDVNGAFWTFYEQVIYGLIAPEDMTAAAQTFMDEANAIITRYWENKSK